MENKEIYGKSLLQLQELSEESKKNLKTKLVVEYPGHEERLIELQLQVAIEELMSCCTRKDHLYETIIALIKDEYRDLEDRIKMGEIKDIINTIVVHRMKDELLFPKFKIMHGSHYWAEQYDKAIEEDKPLRPASKFSKKL